MKLLHTNSIPQRLKTIIGLACLLLISLSINTLAQSSSNILNDFEDGTLQSWNPRGASVVLANSTETAHAGTHSLQVTGRTATWNGPDINVTNRFSNGSRYRVSVWIKLAPGELATNMRVTLERVLNGSTTFHTVIGNTQVTANQWVQLSTTYDYAFNHSSLTLYIESASGTPSFYIDDFELTFIPPVQIQTDIPSLWQTLADHFPVGAAIWQGDITGVHADLLKKHFNSITAENDMKPSFLQPTEGTFNFTTADAFVNFAKANQMRVRGHTLVWHQQNPNWLFKDANGNDLQPTPENKALMLRRLEAHIRGVVGHFKDDVYAWDVVNEVIDESQPNGFRRSQWYLLTGTDYIDTAFRIAHEVAPNARLYINDYSTTNPVKRQFLLNLIRDLKSRGVPIDGIGHQMHNNISFPTIASITQTINLFADLGVDNQITELDMSIYTNSTASYTTVPEEILIQQGYQYRDLFHALRQLKGKVSSVTFWGQADDHTWLKGFPITRIDLPLLFDEQLQAKHAYWGIVDSSKLPGADLETSIAPDAVNVATGQNITYTINLKNRGPLAASNVTLTNAIPSGTVFQSLIAPTGWNCAMPNEGGTGQFFCTTNSMDAAVTTQFKLTVKASCGTTSGTEITDTASANSTSRDPNLADNNSAQAKVKVSDIAPVISGFTTDKTSLYPATGQMTDVTLTYNINDNCDTGLVPTIAISSNEPTSGTSSQDLSPDWEIIDAHHIRLRAERAPFLVSRSGRTYTIILTVTDSSGLKTSSSVNVTVPTKLPRSIRFRN